MRLCGSIGGCSPPLASPRPFQQPRSRKTFAPGSPRCRRARGGIMPTDIELFSISAGGVLEPKADWTEAASKHFKDAPDPKEAEARPSRSSSPRSRPTRRKTSTRCMAPSRGRSRCITSALLTLPTKDGKLDWSIGEPVKQIREATGADYALFSWVRDSYTSDERKATMVAIAVLRSAASSRPPAACRPAMPRWST